VQNQDVPIVLYYNVTEGTHQSRNCNNTQERCDPIIGGSPGEDRYFGKNCTISIPAQKQVGNTIVNGVVIPKHCMPNALDRLLGRPVLAGFRTCGFIMSHCLSVNSLNMFWVNQ